MTKTILVVEDDPMSAKFFELTLKRRGQFEVIVTEDVDRILTLAKERSIDLIVMDISLRNSSYEGERVDGIVLSRLIKDRTAPLEIPILLATAHAMKGDRERFLKESRADGYILKPVIDANGFIQKVRDLTTDHSTGCSPKESDLGGGPLTHNRG
jgi:CheY-like chemotaxis protein